MDFYQVCSNYAPGAKNCLPLGSHVLHRFIKGKHGLVFLILQLTDMFDIGVWKDIQAEEVQDELKS